ncbi:GIY-YIG nuclease family protein [Photorhabdus bodei]|uniref:GIY-YIG nuclease family protein n=1 Tax=Photorhabdus bodei TaxID=2029681 RepID=UPI00232BD667|nr:GIY-YIG nuclease family protein [Photorhabdus bodei]MDB6366732.1 GIY-YIG nuclease family protein [Photorhabdus bodei]
MTQLTVKTHSSVTEAPTMTSLEMVDYINAIAKVSDDAKTIDELNWCLDSIEKLRQSLPDKYRPLCKAIFCHTNSMLSSRIAGETESENEEGIYVIEFDDGYVKIGMTGNFPHRLRVVANQTAAKVIRKEFIPCSNPSKVESMVHRHFCDVRGNGEFFKASFDDCLHIAKAWASKYSSGKPFPK